MAVSESGQPEVITDIATLRAARAQLSGQVAVVLTMGALHDGHVELVRQAAELADHVIVTIFVNPLQFGAGEDFESYPRTLSEDLATLQQVAGLGRAGGVRLVFAPSAAQVYPAGAGTVSVAAGPVAESFEGATRPGHFDGVLTVVLKLLQLTCPDVAVFGAKDAQQVFLIRSMIADFNVNTELHVVDTVREVDGLARSSRNRYLDADERRYAASISQAMRSAIAAGGSAVQIAEACTAGLAAADGVKIDYVAVVSAASFEPMPAAASGEGLLLVAAWVGTTRLIDNMPVRIVQR